MSSHLAEENIGTTEIWKKNTMKRKRDLYQTWARCSPLEIEGEEMGQLQNCKEK